MIWMWTGFLALMGVLLALDLGVFHRKTHAVGAREALRWVAVWVSVALLFGVYVWFAYENHWFGAGLPSTAYPDGLTGTEAAIQYLTGYLLEECLSLDNLFVIALIIGFFRIRPEYQHRVLFWGILGAIITRGAFVGIGVVLIRHFTWIFYVFGALLVYSGLKMGFGKGDEEVDPTKSFYYRLVRRLLPVAPGDHGPRFTVRIDGKLHVTALVPALIVIELTDVMFAVDSVPAIFGVTEDPFLVLTSNLMAIMGLRSLYFVLASSLDRFHHLKTSVTVILVFIGLKMILHDVLHDVPDMIQIGGSLGVVALSLAGGILASLLADRPALTPPPGSPADHPPAGPPPPAPPEPAGSRPGSDRRS